MTETLDLLQRRRSVPVPALAEPGPDAAAQAMILGAASRVPDHGKLVPWRFITFEGAARDAAGAVIAEAFAADHPDADPDALAFERRRLSAPWVVAVVSRPVPHVKIPEWEQVLSAGAACMNLMIAANALGFATSWLTQWYAYDRRVLAKLGLRPDEKIAGFIHIGRPTSVPSDRPRPALADVVTRFASAAP